MPEDLLVDPEKLRGEVREKYRAVALKPDAAYHFHTGRPAAARLGYDQAAVDALPDRAVESFAGVGNPAVVLLDWKDGKSKLLKTKENFQGTAWGVAFHPGGFVIAAGGGNGGGVWFWKGDDAASFHTLKVPASARDMTLAPGGGERFACAGANGTVYVYTFTPGPAPAPPEPKKK